MVEDLKEQAFRFSSDRRYSSARAALTEASRHALADINDSIGGVKLTRHTHIAAVHASLDSGRYVEIRGDAGVGKSGVLKHFADQIGTEAPIIVLSPKRTVPRGWSAMKAMLGFDGSAHELLADLAADGGAVLFVDNLDFFDEDERKTVKDLVRETAGVPGFVVIATARRNFGMEEPNWLPPEALDRLGRVDPIRIGELTETELDELRHATPRLVPLLAANHPAREVTRNLFRLARLASQPEAGMGFRTEVDMAKQWWQTADGQYDDEHRGRARLLRALAEAALSGVDVLDVTHQPPQAINALVKSQTLRDLENDRVAFHHDVLREWAIGNLLHFEPARLDHLPLDRPASVALARGVELTARMAVERETNGTKWQSLLDHLSGEGAHASWRRAVLLALVHSEISHQLLDCTSNLLLANNGSLLRELMRLVIAVDVEPAGKIYAALGIDPRLVASSGIHMPSGPSWHRLILWILKLGESLPPSLIPDVADFYFAWSTPTLGNDPLTPDLLSWYFQWLNEIESARHPANFRDLRQPFGGAIARNSIGVMESTIRIGFLLCCHRTPELAKKYLYLLKQRPGADAIVHSVLKVRGSLAMAAPLELADFTASVLIKKPRQEHDEYGYERKEPFTHYDLDFLSPSPAQGPFYELLTYAPQHGLALIRQLVDHAINFHSEGREYGADAIIIPLPDGERAFPWTQSYRWSRDIARHYCITSALMALEAWGHVRIESGESFNAVLGDVLGTAGSPAAFLLVAVDLILSHWPKSREAAVPFVACAELLCADRQRQLQESIGQADFFGLSALNREPVGIVNLDSLKKRVSRRVSLEVLLSYYALGDHVHFMRRSKLLYTALPNV